ncbi:tripartite tricarboxylate transporter TctB family protein [Aromatoleum toluclasticum]|uniref:tripartite tricarboxylate transporter TctB family protein n=1 Tax=Aromatoleum toluclasticum TaxID=92003 RepID=UPI001D189374|nr:tripartite tricarboxylate transporter TctB family protein [Aromatoleum toluclasticum]MCC4114563.1 tripartite tricarboxylate transporter TctB family protein [Aromatoleum toluclasticum]
MSERIFGGVLLLVSLAGIWIGWDLRPPVSYEPVGPRAFPLLVLALLGVCAVMLMREKTSDTVWAPPPVLRRIGALFLIVLAYALLFDKLGFIVATALMTIPIARFFGGSWKQSVAGGLGLGVGMFIFFDRLLDVALPTGLWLNGILG